MKTTVEIPDERYWEMKLWLLENGLTMAGWVRAMVERQLEKAGTRSGGSSSGLEPGTSAQGSQRRSSSSSATLPGELTASLDERRRIANEALARVSDPRPTMCKECGYRTDTMQHRAHVE